MSHIIANLISFLVLSFQCSCNISNIEDQIKFENIFENMMSSRVFLMNFKVFGIVFDTCKSSQLKLDLRRK